MKITHTQPSSPIYLSLHLLRSSPCPHLATRDTWPPLSMLSHFYPQVFAFPTWHPLHTHTNTYTHTPNGWLFVIIQASDQVPSTETPFWACIGRTPQALSFTSLFSFSVWHVALTTFCYFLVYCLLLLPEASYARVKTHLLLYPQHLNQCLAHDT